MTSSLEFWEHVENSFWAWWLPVFALSFTGLFYMAQLRAAQSFSGSIARICLFLGFICMLGAFVFAVCTDSTHNGIARLGILLIMTAVVLIVRQFAIACVAARKEAPADPSFGKRVLAVLTEDM